MFDSHHPEVKKLFEPNEIHFMPSCGFIPGLTHKTALTSSMFPN